MRNAKRRGAISQSDAHISMLSRVNKKTDRYPERVQKKRSDNHPRMIDSKIKHLLNDVIGHSHMYRKLYRIIQTFLSFFDSLSINKYHIIQVWMFTHLYVYTQ